MCTIRNYLKHVKAVLATGEESVSFEHLKHAMDTSTPSRSVLLSLYLRHGVEPQSFKKGMYSFLSL